jgi:hypothetical protein
VTYVRALDVVRYTRDNRPWTSELILEPTWTQLEAELRTMHRFEKPMLWLLQDPDVPDGDLLCVTGGQDMYHVQIATPTGNWVQAINPEGSDKYVDVWTSDQGFSTQTRFTWRLEPILELVRWYFDHGVGHPKYQWE